MTRVENRQLFPCDLLFGILRTRLVLNGFTGTTPDGYPSALRPSTFSDISGIFYLGHRLHFPPLSHAA